MMLPAVHLTQVRIGDVVFSTHRHEDFGTNAQLLLTAALALVRLGDVPARTSLTVILTFTV